MVSHGCIKKANMMYLIKEASNKDQMLKIQMLVSSDDKDENTLVYCNQGSILTLKAGDYAFYFDYVVLGQLIPARNSPDDIEN